MDLDKLPVIAEQESSSHTSISCRAREEPELISLGGWFASPTAHERRAGGGPCSGSGGDRTWRALTPLLPGPPPWCLGRKAAKATCSLYKAFLAEKGIGEAQTTAPGKGCSGPHQHVNKWEIKSEPRVFTVGCRKCLLLCSEKPETKTNPTQLPPPCPHPHPAWMGALWSLCLL